MKYETTLETSALHTALAAMQRQAGKRSLPALWRCDPDGITIEWGGMSHRITVEGTGTVVVRVAGGGMLGMAKCPPNQEELTVRVEDGTLHIGRRRFTCHEVTVDIAALLLPVGAADSEFLRLHLCEPTEVINQAGLAPAVEERVERVTKTLDKFANKLAWTGLDQATLTRLVWDELANIHQGTAQAGTAAQPIRHDTEPVQEDLLGNSDLPLFGMRNHAFSKTQPSPTDKSKGSAEALVAELATCGWFVEIPEDAAQGLRIDLLDNLLDGQDMPQALANAYELWPSETTPGSVICLAEGTFGILELSDIVEYERDDGYENGLTTTVMEFTCNGKRHTQVYAPECDMSDEGADGVVNDLLADIGSSLRIYQMGGDSSLEDPFVLTNEAAISEATERGLISKDLFPFL